MRYQSPATNPLAHYWEEEIAGLWGSWTRFTVNGKKLINILIGDILLANIYLVIDYLSGMIVFSALTSFVMTVSRRIRILDSFKRILDISGSIVGLIICIPVFMVVPVIIKLDSDGPIFYTQLRVGKNRRRVDRRRMILAGAERRNREDRRKESGFGAPFKIIKFRTMHVNAEASTGPVWASRYDPRVTRIGRVLRKTRIDEFPQLFNVLMGNMSLVGPRPERPFFVAKLDRTVDNYLRRFEVKPGITGLAQVEYKYDESIEDVGNKVSYDLRYIKDPSIVQDIKILLKTVIVVLTARGM